MAEEVMKREVRMPVKNLGVLDSIYSERFTFVVGVTEYDVGRLEACLFSGKVRRLLAGDLQARRLNVDVVDEDKLFGDVISLINGQEVTVSDVNAEFLENVCIILESTEMLEIIRRTPPGALSCENVFLRIEKARQRNQNAATELDFIACHFYELSDRLGGFSDDEIGSILDSDRLHILSEESLLGFVATRRDESGRMPFLRHVRPEFLPHEFLMPYLEYARSNGLMDVWPVICDCLQRLMTSNWSNRYIIAPYRFFEDETATEQRLIREEDLKYGEQDEAMKYKNKFGGGIIEYFRQKCSGNVHEAGVIKITASGDSSTNGRPVHKVADHGWTASWDSNDVPRSWIMFDFKSNIVRPSHYSLRYKNNWDNYPKKWEMTGSNDKLDWTVIDKRDTNSLSAGGRRTFTCNSDNLSFRYLRFTQTGKNSVGSDYFLLSEVEFFGRVRPRDSSVQNLLTEERQKQLLSATKVVDEPKQPASHDHDDVVDAVSVAEDGDTAAKGYGIFSSIRRMSCVDTRVRFSIGVSSTVEEDSLCQITTPGWDGKWQSEDKPCSWIQFDVLHTKIGVTCYALRQGDSKYSPRCWQVSGSVDGQNWTIIDSRETEELSDNECHTFQCESRSAPVTMLRITQTGKNVGDTDTFCLSEVEFFGEITLEDSPEDPVGGFSDHLD